MTKNLIQFACFLEDSSLSLRMTGGKSLRMTGGKSLRMTGGKSFRMTGGKSLRMTGENRSFTIAHLYCF